MAGLAVAMLVAVGCGSGASSARPLASEAPLPTASAATAATAATTSPTVALATASPAAVSPSPAPGSATPSIGTGDEWLAYHWWQPGKRDRDIFLVRPDGTGAHPILEDVPGSHASATWSPDGGRLAFSVSEPAPNGSIWTANADGSDAAPLTDGEGACPDGLAHPAWSPDGASIAFICYPDPDGRQASVAVLDLASKSVTRLTTVAWPEHLDGAPSWSPDGRSLAYAILHWDPTDQFIDGSLLAVVKVAGGRERRISTFASNLSDPDWSPDGTMLATYSYDMGNMHTTSHASNLYLVRPDGTGLRQLTHSSVDGNMRIVEPAWSHDGSRIWCTVGVSHAGDYTTDDLQLAYVDPAGGEPVLLSPTVRGGVPAPRPTHGTAP